jgi:hypothetical protein
MKNFLMSIVLAMTLAVAPAHAYTTTSMTNAQWELNRASPGAMLKHQLGSVLLKSQTLDLKLQYDFSKQGGVVGSIPLLNPLNGFQGTMPLNAVIVGCLIDVITAPTGGGASIAITSGQTAADLKAATAVASYTGLVACIPVGSAATSIKLTADRLPAIVVSGGALTAGKFNVHIQYFMSE